MKSGIEDILVDNDQGVALVFVLWVLVILGVIAGGFSYAMRHELRSAAMSKDEAQAYYLAYAGIQTGLAMLGEDRIGPKTSASKSGKPVWGVNVEIPEQQLGNGGFSIRIGNESGKVNINYADRDLFTMLFRNMNVPENQLKVIVDAILDWRDKDTFRRLNGAENDYYQSLASPYKARNNLFQTIDELAYVKGMTEEIFIRVKPFVTAVVIKPEKKKKKKKKKDYRKMININAASEEMLAMLPWLTSESIEKIIAYRQQKGDIENNGTLFSLFKTVRLDNLTKYIDYKYNSHYTIEASGWARDKKIIHSIRIMVKKDSGDKKGYKIVQWIDRVVQ